MVLKKNWLVLPLLLFVAILISFIYLRYTKPVYSSGAIIQRSASDEGKRILDIENFEKEGSLSEDVELLKSTFLLEKALKNLNLNISYYSEGEILTEEKYLFSSYHVNLLELTDSSMLGVPIHVKLINDQLEFNYTAGGKNKSIQFTENEMVKTDEFSLYFKVNKAELFKKHVFENELYFVINSYSSLTKRLHPSLKVYILNPEAKTIQINFESNNARLATDVVGSLIQTFFQYDLDKKSQSSANILNFINSQLDTAFTQLKESEVQIQSFRDSSNVSNPSMFTEQIMQRTSELQSQQLELDLELALINEVDRIVETNERIEIYQLIPAVNGTNFQNLLIEELTDLHELLINKEDASYNLTSENEVVKKFVRKINSKVDNIKRIVRSIKDQLNFKKRSLQERINKLEGQLYGVPQKEMELARLDRMFKLNEKYYSLLIEKKTQYSISKAGYTTANMVLQAPDSAGMISPNKRLIYVGAIVFAFLLSFIYLIIKYLRFNEIQNPDELRKLLPSKIGYLGIIPKVVNDNENSVLLVHTEPKSVLAESFRHIRSNLQFVLDDNKSNVIAVTSSISGEGKTFVALNLAGIFALSGKKVLVIDLDLRKPKVHLGFKVENINGMSSIFAGKIDWPECIHKSELDGLDFITAGTIPPNPSELIIKGNLDGLFTEFKKEYDVILIDNPPVGIVSDGIIIMNKADCPIYIFRANYSKRVFTDRINELFNSKKVDQLFTILNGVDLKRKNYGYTYGYGYGEYLETKKTKKRR
jgi:tyrosine-protein kinase Etk/Wzc